MFYGETYPGVAPQAALPWEAYPAQVAWPAGPAGGWGADWGVPPDTALDAEVHNPDGIVPLPWAFIRPVRRFAVPVGRFGVPLVRFGVPLGRFGVPLVRFGVPVGRFGVPVRPFAFPLGKPFGRVII